MVLKNLFLLAVSFPVAACGAADVSDAVFVHLRPETSSFWNTATNSVITLPVEFPAGATSATLEVNGLGYSRTYRDVTEGTYELRLPEAVSARTENVYELTLSFDNGTVRTAKIGLVSGVTSGNEGTTCCIPSSESPGWNRIRYRAVLPIPYGMTSFTYSLNGGEPTEVDTGLDGAQGWYAFGPVARGDDVSLSAATPDGDVEASLRGWFDGFFLRLR